MVKRKKKATPAARKKRALDRTSSEAIRKLWTASARKGLGAGKAFHQDIFDAYFPALEKKIDANLAAGAKFDAEAEKNTKQVANDIGAVCRMFTKARTVSKDSFDTVFKFMKNHPLCPGTGGAGGWCDIQTP